MLHQGGLDLPRATAFPHGRCLLALALFHVLQPLAAAPTSLLNPPVALHAGEDLATDSLASISPLLILIGERITKQLLRNITGFPSAFSLATAPMGLITVVSSLVRLCGIQPLRSFLGYVNEARIVAAVETTRANSGGIHGEIVNDQVVRSTSADATSRAIAVFALRGTTSESKTKALEQIGRCNQFRKSCEELRIPSGAVALRWCLQACWERFSPKQCEEALDLIAEAIGWVKNNLAADLARAGMEIVGSNDYDKEATDDNSHNSLSFVCALDSTSEFTGIPETWFDKVLKPFVIGILALIVIVGIFIAELERLGWRPTIAWLLAVVGYLGIVISTVLAGSILSSSYSVVRLPTPQQDGWAAGMVQATIGKAGAPLLVKSGSNDFNPEAIYFKEPTPATLLGASTVAGLLTAAFLCHYLGLRSLDWWVSISELMVCLVSAILRSTTWKGPARFLPSDQRVDWRCSSTGILNVTSVSLENTYPRLPVEVQRLDARVHATGHNSQAPTAAERIAWLVANECKSNGAVKALLLKCVNLRLLLEISSPEPQLLLNVIISFNGGVLVKEGLAFPGACMLLGLPALPAAAISSPAAILARGVLRQPTWFVVTTLTGMRGVLGEVHVPAVDSLVSWWTVSENENDNNALQTNLQWGMIVASIAFFVALLEKEAEVPGVVTKVRTVLEQDMSGSERRLAMGVAKYLVEEGGKDEEESQRTVEA